MISETALKEFKKLYVEEFKEEISDEQAIVLGTNLLTLFNHIYRPIKKEWLEVVSDDKKPNKTCL
jgi:hypothetical protein